MDPAERGIWWVSKMLGAGVVSPLRGVNGIGWLLGAEGSVMQRKQCTDTGLCVQLRTAAESQAEALNLPELFYVLYLFIYFFLSRVASHTQHFSPAAGRNGCGSCCSKCFCAFVQVLLQLGTEMSPQRRLARSLGDGRGLEVLGEQ